MLLVRVLQHQQLQLDMLYHDALQVAEFGSGLDLFDATPGYQNLQDATFMHNLALYSNSLASELRVSISSWFWWW